MKIQIEKVSVHQNAKVFAVLMAVSSLVFVVPFLLFVSLADPHRQGFPGFLVVLFPVVYLIMGYVMTAIACLAYNVLARFMGGLEFEYKDVRG